MEKNRRLGLFISYYLSRFDSLAYDNLGFGNQLATHEKIGELMAINPHTIKNWRDEFDPMFGHRAGWYQRSMSPSRIRVAQALENLDEYQVRSIVQDILSGKIKEEPEQEEQLLSISSDESKEKKTHPFIVRGPTGKKAEEYYQKHFFENKKPLDGKLIDCRDLGVGYDFRIETGTEEYFVEVKGLSDFTGGLMFTNKEWTTAEKYQEKYFLCLVSNLKEKANIIFIQNPAEKFKPKKNMYTSIQISWSVSQNQLSEIYD
ncbi:MAG: DUF3883 domain-containing protein [Bacteroidetes bacterium]|nr:DUF3883 domain-containing protein [Bacteroidota bacterium]